MLTEHRAQRRLGDLGRRDHVVLDLDDRRLRVDDPEVGDGVDAHRHVVLRDHLLRRDLQGDRAQVDPDHPVDDRDQDEEAGALGLGQEPAEPEDDSPLVLARDLQRADRKRTTTRRTTPAAIRTMVTRRSYSGSGRMPIAALDRMHAQRQALEAVDDHSLARPQRFGGPARARARRARRRGRPRGRRPAGRRSPAGRRVTGVRLTAIAFAIAKAQSPPSTSVTMTTSGTEVCGAPFVAWNIVARPNPSATDRTTVSAPWVG